MGKQNDAFTAYLGRAEVLADLYNGCLYQGEEVVKAGNLCEVQQFYQQGLSERVKRPTARRRERDAIRAFWNEKRSSDADCYDRAVSWHGTVGCSKEAQ